MLKNLYTADHWQRNTHSCDIYSSVLCCLEVKWGAFRLMVLQISQQFKQTVCLDHCWAHYPRVPWSCTFASCHGEIVYCYFPETLSLEECPYLLVLFGNMLLDLLKYRKCRFHWYFVNKNIHSETHGNYSIVNICKDWLSGGGRTNYLLKQWMVYLYFSPARRVVAGKTTCELNHLSTMSWTEKLLSLAYIYRNKKVLPMWQSGPLTWR